MVPELAANAAGELADLRRGGLHRRGLAAAEVDRRRSRHRRRCAGSRHGRHVRGLRRRPARHAVARRRRHTHRTAAVCVDRGLGPRPGQARRACRGAGVRRRTRRRRRAGPRSPVARRDRRGGRSDRRPRRRRRRAHAHPARARRLRPRLDTHTGRARRRARRGRCRRADPAARRHRRPGRLPGAGRAGRVSRVLLSSGTQAAAHPTASATSPASGFRWAGALGVLPRKRGAHPPGG